MQSLRSFPIFLRLLLLCAFVAPVLALRFLQTHDGVHLHSISKEKFLAAPFAQLCVSGNCIDDCNNHTRVFQAVPDGVQATVRGYGQPDKSGQVDVTFFGLCTNLVSASNLVNTQDSAEVKQFFDLKNRPSRVNDTFKLVALGIAACISDTCGRTRNPERCGEACGTTSLLNDNTDRFDWRRAMLNCTQSLCKSADVLPYADQDVLGIGVSSAYVLFNNCV
jgi:hypothetical protein